MKYINLIGSLIDIGDIVHVIFIYLSIDALLVQNVEGNGKIAAVISLVIFTAFLAMSFLVKLIHIYNPKLISQNSSDSDSTNPFAPSSSEGF